MYFKQDEHGIIHVYLNEVPVILNYNYSINVERILGRNVLSERLHWPLSLAMSVTICTCLKAMINYPFTCWMIISFCNSTRTSTTCSKCRTEQHHCIWHENSGAVCSTLMPSPQQMTGCRTLWKTSMNSLASTYDFQNCSIGTGVWQDHTKAVLEEDKPEWLRPVTIEKAYFHGLTTFPKDPSIVA